MKTLRALLRLFFFALLSLVIVAAQTLILPFHRGRASYILPRLWAKGTRHIFGLKIICEGTPATARQTIYVSNHLSYLDIPVLGSFVLGSFIARGDLSGWPVFGYMARMQQTIFISRKREDAAKGKAQLEEVLAEEKNIIIFAEGTSSDGSAVLPFKSSLFSLALDNPTGTPLMVQPVTIALQSVADRPASTSSVRDLYAWHSDMTLGPHIWKFARLKGAVIRLTFHPPRDAATYDNRKTLCQDCYQDVVTGLELPEPAKSDTVAQTA